MDGCKPEDEKGQHPSHPSLQNHSYQVAEVEQHGQVFNRRGKISQKEIASLSNV